MSLRLHRRGAGADHPVLARGAVAVVLGGLGPFAGSIGFVIADRRSTRDASRSGYDTTAAIRHA